MIRIVYALGALVLATGLQAQALFVEGDHYRPLESPAPVADPSKIEVLEIFSYGCPHCYHFEEDLAPWAAELPKDVYLRRLPASLGHRFFAQMSAAFHAAKHFGVQDLAHDRLFVEIHENGNRAIAGFEGMAQFFAEFGIEPEELEAYLRSEGLQKTFSDSEESLRQYPLTGVPTVIVNGKYHVNRNEHVTSYAQLLDVVDYLIELERDAAPATM